MLNVHAACKIVVARSLKKKLSTRRKKKQRNFFFLSIHSLGRVMYFYVEKGREFIYIFFEKKNSFDSCSLATLFSGHLAFDGTIDMRVWLQILSRSSAGLTLAAPPSPPHSQTSITRRFMWRAKPALVACESIKWKEKKVLEGHLSCRARKKTTFLLSMKRARKKVVQKIIDFSKWRWTQRAIQHWNFF